MRKEFFISIRVFPVEVHVLYLPTKFQWSVLQIGQDSSIYIQFNSFIATSSHKKITQTVVINIAFQGIFIENLTFHMLVNIHFQKSPLQFLKTIYTCIQTYGAMPLVCARKCEKQQNKLVE